MKSFLSISKNNSIRSICIGKFDGVHLAHQAIFSKLPPRDCLILLICRSGERQVLTPNPQDFTSLPIFYLELEKIKDMGDKEFAEFLLSYLPHLREIVVGYDFLFGKDRAYTPRDLQEFFDVVIVPEICLEGEAIHTQGIIYALQSGEIQRANAMLGRAYHIQGDVIRGQGLGRRELVPTFNLLCKDYVLPQSGVYATMSEVEGKRYKSVSFLGHRISTDGEFAIETHLIGEEVRLTPSRIKIHFYERLRDNQKFENLQDLKTQIAQDIFKAQKILEF